MIRVKKSLVNIIYKLLKVLIFYKIKKFNLLYFLQYIMIYILNIENAIKIMVKDLKKFIFESYYKWIGFTRKDNYYSLGKVKKI